MHRHTFIHATHFSRFIPLSPLAILLWIWYFLIPFSRLSFVIYRYISYSPSSFIPASHLAPVLPLSFSLQPHLLLPSPSLLRQSSSHSFVFIPCSSLWRAPFSPFLFYRFIASRFRAPLSIIISSLAFSTLYLLTRGLHCTFSTPSISSIHTATRAPRWIFILCVSYLHTTGLGLKWLKSSISYLGRFKYMHSD